MRMYQSLARRSRLAAKAGVLAIVLAIAVAGFFIVQRRVTRPITKMTEAMGALAAGDMDVEIVGATRSDEIGDMARAVEVFKRDAIERQRLDVVLDLADLALRDLALSGRLFLPA